MVHDDFLKRFAGEQDADVTSGEEYPPPTFTPSEETYDRVEIEDSYVMLSGNRNSPPVHRRYSLLNGNEIKER